MLRPLSIALLVAFATQGPAIAQANAGLRATLAAAPAEPSFVVREQMWRCTGAVCTAAASNSRPLVLCMALARKAGPVMSFEAAGMALGTELLARCNAVAPTVADMPR
jgi:hypothetical protein